METGLYSPVKHNLWMIKAEAYFLFIENFHNSYQNGKNI